MSALDTVLPDARQVEVRSAELALPAERAWEVVRHLDLAELRIANLLFWVRTIPDRLAGGVHEKTTLRLDDVRSTTERPGFQVLVDDPPHEVVVGAIGKVWHLDIPFVHVPTAAEYAAFDEPGFVKVAWAVRVTALTEQESRVAVEVRVGATDEESWRRFRRYFLVIGPASRFIRRSFLAELARRHGTPGSFEETRELPGDELLPDARGQRTHAVTIHAGPDAVWPWLVQLGCRRAGYYSIDVLDNAWRRSAREIHPELQHVAVGDILPATPAGDAGFEVLRVEPERLLLLGGLYDAAADRQLPFASPRPERYWQVTWAFVLEARTDGTTRLIARVRGAFPASANLHATWVVPLHTVMETAQLRHLATRVEGRARRDDWRDVARGMAGAGAMAGALATPFLRDRRTRWGADAASASRRHPGDELIARPRWGWTHGIEVDAPAADVWPWVAQLGADRGGFYSYQWLENVIGCDVRNAEVVHPEWELREGDAFVLHPDGPPMTVVAVEPGRFLVAHGDADPEAVRLGKPWMEASWLLLVEPVDEERCRVISRFRCATSSDPLSRIAMGPAVGEAIGGTMDRRMLRGIRMRAEAARDGGRRVRAHRHGPGRLSPV